MARRKRSGCGESASWPALQLLKQFCAGPKQGGTHLQPTCSSLRSLVFKLEGFRPSLGGSGLSLRRCAAEPFLEADRAKARIATGGEGLVVQLRAEVAGHGRLQPSFLLNPSRSGHPTLVRPQSRAVGCALLCVGRVAPRRAPHRSAMSRWSRAGSRREGLELLLAAPCMPHHVGEAAPQ